MKYKWNIILKWGAILGAGLSALEVLKMLARKVNYPFSTIADLLLILVFILVLVKAVQIYRDKSGNGFISFSKSYGIGLGVICVSFLFFFCYLLIHFNLIEKEGLARINATLEQNYTKRISKEPVPENEISIYLANAQTIIRKQCDKNCEENALADKDLTVQKIDTICIYFSQRLGQGEKDTSNYSYKNFDQYAQTLLINTNEQMINEMRDTNAVLVSLLRSIAIQSASELNGISPLAKRLESEKDKIPHYDNTITASIVSSLIATLYGLLINIFTALYVFRKKGEHTCGAINDNEKDETKNK